MGTIHILTFAIAAFMAELPVFVLILHLAQRIVKLETHIEILIRRIDHERP